LELQGDVNAENLKIIGKTIDEAAFKINGEILCMEECLAAWTAPLEAVFPTMAETEAADISSLPIYEAKNVMVAKNKVARPRVFIPVFPGTNCEWDVAAKFEIAGADADIFILNNLTSQQLSESVAEMARRIADAQIIAIPGGFSAGDEPDGSGKFIGAIFKNAAIKAATEDLINRREGLMIGICNGFQALVHLGLVPFGEMRQMEDDSPILTYNAIGRHISNLVTTKIISNKSPWLAGVSVGDVHRVAASHGQGRFAVSDKLAQELFANGQVAAVYADLDGKPTMRLPYNPNGSMYGIEAITSPDGRILGKMCHSERIGGLYKNVPGDYEQHVFASGVKYFR